MNPTRLDELRNQIDQLDQQIISLLAERFRLTEEVGIFKNTHQLQAQDPAREAEQFKKMLQLSLNAGLKPEYTQEIYRCIMNLVIARHQELRQAQ